MGGKFYVYEHWRPDRDECFYVGKGNGRRANDMRRGRNRFHKFIQMKLSTLGMAVEVRIVVGNLNEDDAFHLERKRISFWRSVGADLANITDGGEGPSGRKHTEKWKTENSQRNTGKKMSPEACAKIAAALKGNKNGLGKKRPQKSIEASRKAHIGRVVSPETRAKISAAKKENPRIGFRMSTDAIAKIRNNQIGKPKSEETKAKMKKPKTKEHKQKLQEANKGKTHSESTKILLSKTSKEMWRLRKINSNLTAGG